MQKEAKYFISTILIALASATCSGLSADEQQPRDEKTAQRRIGLLDWHTDYLAAYEQAKAEQKQLLIFFRDEAKPYVADNYESRILASDKLWTPLSQYVRVALPLDTPEPQEKGEKQGEKPKRLIDHRAFVHMNKRQGIAVIDLAEPKTRPYGFVTSAHPFTPGRYYSAAAMQTVLELPRGTLTQRTLLYALRMHPERPRYPNSGMNPYLSEQARQASATMAQLEQVGHHNWGYRFQSITSALGGRPVSEVAASGNGETLVDAAVSCVAAWRGSPTHWQMINTNPLLYGYDLVRGRSGNWYATGILGSGR